MSPPPVQPIHRPGVYSPMRFYGVPFNRLTQAERASAAHPSLLNAKPKRGHTEGRARAFASTWLTACFLLAATHLNTFSASPETKEGNPYQAIPTRNAFGIQPPPTAPPPPPPPIQTPTEPPADVFLTGFSLWNGEKKVYLQVNPKGGTPFYLELGEGEFERDIDVLEINPKKEFARIKNAGQEMTVDFKNNGLKYSAPAPAAAPGRPATTQRGRDQQRGQPRGGDNRGRQPQAAATQAGPTIISRGGSAAVNAQQQNQGGGNYSGIDPALARRYGLNTGNVPQQNTDRNQVIQGSQPIRARPTTTITPPLPPIDPSRLRQ